MGIYDRDYYRQEQRPGFSLGAPHTMVGTLILINVAVYLVDGLFFAENHQLTKLLAASGSTLSRPWMWWQLLTYGFAHAASPYHVLFNMLQLWFLGREVEQRYGSREFLRLYLVILVLGSVIWAISHALLGRQVALVDGQPVRIVPTLVGASGAISGVVLLFVLNFPQRTLVLFPIPIPVRAWVIGVMLVVVNVMGAVSQRGNIAFGVHLTGLAFAYIYFRSRWNLARMTGGLLSFGWLKPRPKLRVHDPRSEDRRGDLGEEVDRILEKIHNQGQDSLTRQERRTLETASRQYQKKRP